VLLLVLLLRDDVHRVSWREQKIAVVVRGHLF
jgi:hypothetical protein